MKLTLGLGIGRYLSHILRYSIGLGGTALAALRLRMKREGEGLVE
jgi:hypothetical protein